MSAPRPMWALLVGIDRFAAQSNLDGCVNDSQAMQALLTEGYGVDDGCIAVLRDEDATRQGIINAFFSHLIENPKVERGDQIIFHFSGHGANMLDPLGASPTGYIESLVAHDSGLDGIFNIPDTTVAALLELLSHSKGDNITVVLDCCHSGNGTREGGERAPKSRLTEPDRRQPPAQLDADIVDRATALGVKKRWRQEGLPYTLLAACRDRELAQEYIDYGQDDEPAFGAFTWHLVDALWRLQPKTSYAILHEEVAARVNVYNPNQMPQCEGNADRSVFGAKPVRRDPFIKVIGTHKGELVLDGGRVHGLGKGAILELYPPGVLLIDDLPDTPLATAEVTWVGASRARAYVDTANPDALMLAKARVIQNAEDVAPRRVVALEVDPKADVQARDGIERLRAQIERSTLLRLAEDRPAEFVVRAEGRNLVIRGNDEPGALVWPDAIGASARSALLALENIARFRRVVGLRNEDPASRLQGRLRIQLRRFEDDKLPQEMTLVEPVDSELVVTFDAEAFREADDDTSAMENLYLVEVINDGPTPVFINVLTLGADYSIYKIYPAGSEEGQRLDGHQSLYVGYEEGTDPFEAYLPGDGPGETQWTVAHDRIKVVATLQPSNLKMLCQDGLEVMPPKGAHRGGGLEALIDQSVSGHRHVRKRRKSTDDWATGDLCFTTVRKPDGVRIEGGTAALDNGITVHAPAGFDGRVELSTLGQATRSVGGLGLPPGLAGQGAFAPLGLSGSRGAGSDVVVTLTLDESQRAKIAPDNPLRITTRGSEGLWPIVFDGEDYLLAGRPEAGGASITGLPAPIGPASRGALERSVKLFFYKKTGQDDPTVGLHTVRMADGEPVYSDTRAEDVPQGSRSLLVVHGFGSGTFGQTRALAPALSTLGYDTVLAYDYESFGTPLAETGEALADALRSAGFGPDDGRSLDIVAHSMGGLVTRAMIELSGGEAYVDRLLMAGTPNAGTKLMTAVDGLHRLADIAMNKVLGPAVGGVLSWLLNAVFKAALGPSDLRPGSVFLDRLNRGRGGQIPYLVLDGRGGIPGTDDGWVKRLAKKGTGLALDLIFGEPNDLIVGADHMAGVQSGAYPKLSIHEVGCNHFDYLSDGPSQDVMRAFFGGGDH